LEREYTNPSKIGIPKESLRNKFRSAQGNVKIPKGGMAEPFLAPVRKAEEE
jgi:hypothetical protein